MGRKKEKQVEKKRKKQEICIKERIQRKDKQVKNKIKIGRKQKK